MMQGIAGKVAIVTGASSGIGRATALAFGAHGAKVVVASRRPDKSQQTVDMIRAEGGEAIFIPTDVSIPADVEGLINATVETYGRIDFACNNAAVLGQQIALADSSEENWDQVIATNLKSIWSCMKYEIGQMLKQGGGAIVNVASVGGLVGLAGFSAYVASKHGVLGLTKTAALEYAKAGIRVNAICPSAVLTEMIGMDYLLQTPGLMEQVHAMQPIGRVGLPEDMAASIVWLCSEQASFITGQALPVDGGVTTK